MSGENRTEWAQQHEKRRQSVVKNVLMDEIREKLPLSARYKEQATNAKTVTKHKYMMKKLAQNNKRVRDLFVALDKLNPNKDEPDNS